MSTFVLILCFSILCFVSSFQCCAWKTVTPQDELKLSNKIKSLPGQPNGVNFDHYSGYVTVDPGAGRALFYYFVESPQDSATKPLVLWLGSASGCSAFGSGALMALGPFRVLKDSKTLYQNEYAWNSEANIIFLESPAGVGFSYSNKTSDYDISGDDNTARDSYTFIINWLERFPEYKTRDFFLAGEGYTGHYAPHLAQLILRNNNYRSQTTINLKGIAIGNPYIDYETQLRGLVDYHWSHALISDEIYTGLTTHCNFSSPTALLQSCSGYLEKADDAIGNIFRFDIYAPLCKESSSDFTSITSFDPCSKNYTLSYLNIPEVQKALHAIPYPWESCNVKIFKGWKDRPLTVLPIIQELMKSGMRLWIYSGDTTGVVTVTSTRYAIKKLGTSVKTAWYPWYTQGEVGGYAVEYNNLTFVTVRGAGQLVASYQPARSHMLFSSFINGKLPPPN